MIETYVQNDGETPALHHVLSKVEARVPNTRKG